MVVLSPAEAVEIWDNLKKRKLEDPEAKVPGLTVMLWVAHEFLSRFNFLCSSPFLNFNQRKKYQYIYSVNVKGTKLMEVKYKFDLDITEEVRHGEPVFEAVLSRKQKGNHEMKMAVAVIPVNKIIDFNDAKIDTKKIEFLFNELHQQWKRLWENLARSRSPSTSIDVGAPAN